jgi:hypothetical protein
MMISEKTKKALSMAAVSAVGTGVSYDEESPQQKRRRSR